jgi:Nitroreductase
MTAPHTPPSATTPAGTTPAYETLSALLHTRYSCRAFLPQALDRATIDRILAAAQRTASWCNAQPWQLTIASGATLARLRSALQAHVATEPPAPDLPWPRNTGASTRSGAANAAGAFTKPWAFPRATARPRHGRRPRTSPCSVRRMWPSSAATRPWACMARWTAAPTLATFLLAAHSLGVATIAQAALAAYPSVLREALGIAQDRSIVCGISFGLADPAHPANGFRTQRAAPGDSVTWRD